ncbi:glucoamylase family protein [Stenotrophomonas indicatrix]
MQARHLMTAAAMTLAIAACKPAQQEPAKPRPPVILIEADAPPRPMKPELPPLFDDIERRTFQFFWDTTNEINGLTPDRYPSRPFASIASVGFALTAYPIGIENGWVSRNQAIDRTLTTLKFFRDVPMGPQRTGKAGYKGFYYHFLDMQEGRRYDSWVELSSVDTALLMMGVLFAQSYYDGDDPREKEIRQIADTLYKQVDWPWLQQRAPLISMGWFPENGFIDHDWMGYNEAMMVYILALGSPSHPVSPDAWTVWTRTYDNDWGVYQGQEYLSFGPLFGHQYSHVWIDFRDIQDAYMRERGSTYFLNSRSAALAQREYAIANPMNWKEYGENVWGLTASDGPQNTTQEYRGEQRQFRHYSSRGAGLRENFDDGTIAPTAAIASVVFAPEEVIPATLEMHKRYGDYIYSSYGFLDSFNPSFNYDIPIKTGRVVPDRGWVASDYIAIDQGPILTMIANYRNDFVWDVMKKNPYIRKGLERAGFSGGWLAPEGSFQPLELQKDEKAAAARAVGIAESRAAAAQEQKNNANRNTGQGK